MRIPKVNCELPSSPDAFHNGLTINVISSFASQIKKRNELHSLPVPVLTAPYSTEWQLSFGSSPPSVSKLVAHKQNTSSCRWWLVLVVGKGDWRWQHWGGTACPRCVTFCLPITLLLHPPRHPLQLISTCQSAEGGMGGGSGAYTLSILTGDGQQGKGGREMRGWMQKRAASQSLEVFISSRCLSLTHSLSRCLYLPINLSIYLSTFSVSLSLPFSLCSSISFSIHRQTWTNYGPEAISSPESFLNHPPKCKMMILIAMK